MKIKSQLNVPKSNGNNVIDLAERAEQPISAHFSVERLENLKRRLDVQNGKIAIGTTLLSIVVLVTLANNSLLTHKSESPVHSGGRGIASVPTGTSDAEDSLVEKLSRQGINDKGAIGHKPSEMERFSIGYLEGNYAIQLHDGKLREIQFSQAAGERSPKHIDDLSTFIESNRNLLPVKFDKMVQVGSRTGTEGIAKTFELVNKISMTVAKIEILTNEKGDLLALQVEPSTPAVQ